MKETTKSQTKPPVDREAVRVLAIELGAREAARRLGLKEDTVCSWARRYNWQLPQRKSGQPGTDLASTLHTAPGDVLLDEHKRLEGQTKTGLSRAAAKAAEHASTLPPSDIFKARPRLRDLAASAARIFGWESDKPSVTFNQLVVDAETLGKIRALRDADNPFKKPISEGDSA